MFSYLSFKSISRKPGWLVVAREREMFYLTTHSTHYIYSYMVSDIWLRTILIVRKETRCRHIGYSYRLTAWVLLYAPSHRQDSTYHGLCYTSRGALAGTRNSSMGPPHEGSIRRPIALWPIVLWPIAPRANALPLSNVPLLYLWQKLVYPYSEAQQISTKNWQIVFWEGLIQVISLTYITSLPMI